METATPKAQLHLQRVLQQCGDYNFSPTPRTAARKESLYTPEPIGASLPKVIDGGARRSSRYRSHSILSLDNNGNTPSSSRDVAQSNTTLNRAPTVTTEDEDPTVQYHMRLEASTNSSAERQQQQQEELEDSAAAEAMADAHEDALLEQLAQQKAAQEEAEEAHAHEAVSNHEGQAEVNMVVEPPSESADESAADRYAEVSEEEEAYDPYAQAVEGPHEDEYPEEAEAEEDAEQQQQEEDEEGEEEDAYDAYDNNHHDGDADEDAYAAREDEEEQQQQQDEEEEQEDAYDGHYAHDDVYAAHEQEEEEQQQQHDDDAYGEEEQEEHDEDDYHHEDEEGEDRGDHHRGYGASSEEETAVAGAMATAAYDRGLHDVAGRYADAEDEEEEEDEYREYPHHEAVAPVDETQPFEDREAVAPTTTTTAAEAEAAPNAETHELYRAISNAKRMLCVPAEDALADPIAYQRLLGASPAPEEIPQTAEEATNVVESLPLHALANYREQQARAASADPALAEEVGYWKDRAEALRQQIIERETILQQQQMEREHEEMEAAERAAAARARSMSVAEEYAGEDPLEHLCYQERDGRRRVVREEEEHFFALLEVADRSLDRALGAGPLLADAPDLAHYPAHMGEEAVLVNIALEAELVDLRRQLHAANARIEELRYSNAELRKAVEGRAASQAVPPSLRSAVSLFH